VIVGKVFESIDDLSSFVLMSSDRSIKPTIRVLVHGLVYFGRVFAKFMSGNGWEFRYYPDSGMKNLADMAIQLCSCDIVYQIGGRVSAGKFLTAAKLLGKEKIVMHWVGSDTLDEQNEVAAGKADPWVLGKLHHWAESEWMVKEVHSLGVPCELVPLPSGLVPEKPSPLPKEFRVLVYMPTIERSSLYGLDRILEVARELAHVPFELVGLLDGPIPNPPLNLKIHGRIPDLAEFIRRSSMVWRPVRHDGVSWMVMESLGHGRHVLWTYPFPGCIDVKDAVAAREQIARLYQLHQQGKLQINEDGARFMASGAYSPQIVKKSIQARLNKILQS
jgi:hypothetical protein